jgi:hypothetical protein
LEVHQGKFYLGYWHNYFHPCYLARPKKYWQISTHYRNLFINSFEIMKTYVIRLKKGDEVISEIIDFCDRHKIASGWLSGLGAASHAELAIYDLEKKEYFRKTISDTLEIANLTGNISKLDSKTTIHCHATLALSNFNAVAGHVDKLIVAATCEIIIFEIEAKLERKHDQEIGLNLLEI